MVYFDNILVWMGSYSQQQHQGCYYYFSWCILYAHRHIYKIYTHLNYDKKHTNNTHSTHVTHATLTFRNFCPGFPPGGLPMSAVLWCSMCCRGTRPWTAMSADNCHLAEWRHTKLNCREAEGRTILFNSSCSGKKQQNLVCNG